MKHWIAVALVAGATLVHAQGNGKKDLVARILQAQQPGIENIGRTLAERPALQLRQAAAQALAQVPADKREAVGKQIDADLQAYVQEAVPILRERAVKLAPTTLGAALEEKFTEDELRQILAWFESPVNRKYQQELPGMQDGFVQKLLAEGGPLLDPKIAALQDKIRSTLGVQPPAGAASGPAATPGRPASK